MSFSGYLLFLAVYVAAVASPGPAVAAVVARALSVGAARTLPFIAGVTLGDLVWFWLSAAGLAVVAERFHTLFLIVKYAGVAYLLWLAVKLWRAPADVGAPPPQARGEGVRLFLGGLSLTLGNPKVMVFFLAILPNLIDVGRVSTAALALASATIAVVLPIVMIGYATLADRARRLVSSAAAQRRVNRATAALMAGAAAAVAAK
ncbi:MAG: LysE family translocator [Methylobacteriaceae bacterium]|nr:LysE family translocator [Methylobacteriaceae bacterium]